MLLLLILLFHKIIKARLRLSQELETNKTSYSVRKNLNYNIPAPSVTPNPAIENLYFFPLIQAANDPVII